MSIVNRLGPRVLGTGHCVKMSFIHFFYLTIGPVTILTLALTEKKTAGRRDENHLYPTDKRLQVTFVLQVVL